MSKQNKIHPAHYTQRGRLTPDDAAREAARQRSIGVPARWQMLEEDALPGSKARAQAKADVSRTANARAMKKTVDQAKTARITKPAAPTTATGNKRKAVLARNVGGPALKPLRPAKRAAR